MVPGRFRRKLAIVLSLALGLRLLALIPLLLDPSLALHADSGSYLKPAHNLLLGNGFSQQVEAPFTPDIFRTPVYPAFLALVGMLFGESLRAIALIQSLMDVGACAGVGLLSRRLFGDRAGLVAAFFYATSLVSVAHVGYVASETLFVTLLVGIAWLTLGGKEFGLRRTAVVGVAWAALVLCRPIGLLVLPVVALGVLMRARRAIPAMVVLALIGGVFITPWLVRNHEVSGVWTFASVGDYNLLAYNAASVEAFERGVSNVEARQTLLREVNEQLQPEAGLGDRIVLYRQRAREILLRDPVRTTLIHLRCDLNSLLPAATDLLQITGVTEGGKGTLAVLNERGLLAAVDHYFGGRRYLVVVLAPAIALWFAMLICALLGLARLWRTGGWVEWVVLGGIAAVLLIAPGGPSNPRFAAPAVPVLAPLAGLGAVGIWNLIRQVMARSAVRGVPSNLGLQPTIPLSRRLQGKRRASPSGRARS